MMYHHEGLLGYFVPALQSCHDLGDVNGLSLSKLSRYIQLHHSFCIDVWRRHSRSEQGHRRVPGFGSPLCNLISCDGSKACPKEGIGLVLQEL